MSKACSAEGTGVVDFVGSAIGPLYRVKPHGFGPAGTCPAAAAFIRTWLQFGEWNLQLQMTPS